MKQVCSYCIMDNESDYTITFDENGQCNYCKDTIKRLPLEYFPNEEGQKKLEKMIEEIKANTIDDKYNCMVGVSGGIDSSYLLYLGYKYDLKMLAVHIDDGLDTETAKENIEKLCKKTNTELIYVKPNEKEYKDLLLSFFKASVPNLAVVQDNILLKAITETARKYDIKYSLSGANFALESILERSDGVNANDVTHIRDIHGRFGNNKIKEIKFQNFIEAYIGKKYLHKTKTFKPLDYIDYNLKGALKDLADFCDFEYYGGKHYESVLTRFMQCYYLPVKYNKDKRKSHFSSMIVSGQMTREEALAAIEKNDYIDSGLFDQDVETLADYFNLSLSEMKDIIMLPAKEHSDYKISKINALAPIARKFRRFLG